MLLRTLKFIYTFQMFAWHRKPWTVFAVYIINTRHYYLSVAKERKLSHTDCSELDKWAAIAHAWWRESSHAALDYVGIRHLTPENLPSLLWAKGLISWPVRQGQTLN